MLNESALHANQSTASRPTVERDGKTALKFKLPVIGFLLIFSVLLTVDRLFVPQMPLGPDAAVYAVISHELLQGKSLYTDVWDHKPPAIFVVNAAAEIVGGYSVETIKILNLLIYLTVLFGIFFAAKNGSGGAVGGILAAGLWVILSGTFGIEGRDPNTEIYINACVVWAFALLSGERDLSKSRIFIISLLLTLATLFKPVAIAYAAFLLCAHIVFPAPSNRRKAVTDTLLIAAVGAVGWLGVFVYFAATSRFEIFYRTIVSYNGFYAGNIGENLIAPLIGRSELFYDFMNPAAFLTFAGIALLAVFRRFRLAAMLAAYVAASWFALALPGKFYVHYYQLWLPPLIIGAAWTIGFFALSPKFPLRAASFAAGFLLLATAVYYQISPYRSALAGDFSPFINPPLANSGDIAQKINNLLESGETFLLWGNTPNLYFLTKRRPPVAFLFEQHLNESPISETLVNRAKADLAQTRPKLLITESNKKPPPDWIMQNYEPNPIFRDEKTYTFYLRR